MIKAVIFDWGNTIMKDLGLMGPASLWPSLEWIPGAEYQLQQLQGRYRLMIATSAAHSDREEMIKALKRMGADPYFEAFFSSFELDARKPDPVFFEKILALTGLDAASVVSVGDKYPNDVVAAKSAGLLTVWFNSLAREGSFPAADCIIHDMSLLEDALVKISRMNEGK